MQKKLVVIDLETSGLDKDKHAIIQIGAIALTLPDYKEVDSFEVKIKFKALMASPSALLVNNVVDYDGDVSDYETIAELPEGIKPVFVNSVHEWNSRAIHPKSAVTQLNEWLRHHATVGKVSKKNNIYYVAQLAGHNICNFDLPFLQSWYKRLDEFMPCNWFALDTLQMALERRVLDGIDYPDLKLETLCKFHGVAFEQTHDALGDVRLCAAVLPMIRANVAFDTDIAEMETATQKAMSIIEGLPIEVRSGVNNYGY